MNFLWNLIIVLFGDTAQLWPIGRTGAHTSWKLGSVNPMANDVAQREAKDSERKADWIIDAHIREKQDSLRR